MCAHMWTGCVLQRFSRFHLNSHSTARLQARPSKAAVNLAKKEGCALFLVGKVFWPKRFRDADHLSLTCHSVMMGDDQPVCLVLLKNVINTAVAPLNTNKALFSFLHYLSHFFFFQYIAKDSYVCGNVFGHLTNCKCVFSFSLGLGNT